MDWLERLTRVLDYIEANLAEEIDLNEAAKLACCSGYHFPRMFTAMSGVTLSEHIRRRRLSLAAFELQMNENVRVIDLAVKYGYDSPDSFTRAFRQQHGINPAAARDTGISLTVYPRISFQITVKGDKSMEFRIEELDFSFTVAGRSERVITKQGFEIVPGLWKKAQEDGFVQRLIDMSWEKPKCKLESILGIVGTKPAIKDEEYDYFMGVRYEDPVLDLETIVIPACTWAVFPNACKETWKRLYSEWLPASGYELDDAPCIECFYAPDHKPLSELWVPVKGK